MNLKRILDNVLTLGSNISVKDGREIYKSKLVSNLSSKNINGIYHIYSKVSEEDNKRIHSCHIKVDLKTDKVLGATCTCNTYEEFSKYKKNYICKHIVATIFKFYIVAKNKIKQNYNEENKINDAGKGSIVTSNRTLNLDFEIKEIYDDKDRFFDIVLKIGDKSSYLVPKIVEFLEARRLKKSLRINGEFLYNPFFMSFSNEDEEVLKYIENNISDYKKNDEFYISDRRTLRINEKYLDTFLRKIESNKKIKLNFDYINYDSNILKENLPLSFTVKMEENKIVLTSKKRLPTPINSDFTAFINDRQIYIPEITQVKAYRPLWMKLKHYGKVEYNKSLEELSLLLKTINSIGTDVYLSEGVRRLCRELWRTELYFFKSRQEISCRVTVNYYGENFNICNDNKRSFLRDDYFEDEIIRYLEKLRFIKRDEKFIFIGNDDELYELLSSELKLFNNNTKITFDNSFNEVTLIESNNIEALFEDGNGKLEFKYNVEGIEFSEYKNIFKSLEEGEKYYKTKSGRLLNLRDLGIISFFNMVNNLSYEKELNGLLEADFNKAIFLKESIEKNNLDYIGGKTVLENISEKLNYRDDNEVKCPNSFNGELRNYQLIGLNYFRTLSNMGLGGILADEMGLGKTVQVIAYLLLEKGKKSVIVAPTSLIYNWQDEIEKFAPDLKVAVIHGSKSVREEKLNRSEEYDILLTTYGTIKNDIDFYNKKIFDYCIIDEAQNIKNPKAQNTKVVKMIKAKVKFALTGTPIENNLLELWSIFDFIMPGYLFDEKKFKIKYINKGKDEIEELKSLIKPFILRRLKRDVVSELPEKIEIKKYVSMTPKQSVAYKNYIKEVRLKLKSGEEDKITILSYLTRLRQLCQDPSLVNKEYVGGSGKLELAKNIIKEIILNKDKILVFSQFTSVLKNLKKELSLENIESMYLDGSINAKERVKLVEDFNKEDKIKVFLISLKAGGTGLNLTSANVVMHMDPWWNPAIEDQATDRAHRIGQKKVVEVIKLIAKDTIEEKIIKLQEDKREIINSVINTESLNVNNIAKLNNEEILELFK